MKKKNYSNLFGNSSNFENSMGRLFSETPGSYQSPFMFPNMFSLSHSSKTYHLAIFDVQFKVVSALFKKLHLLIHVRYIMAS